MAELLETNHLPAFFLVVGTRAALGAIRFGPLCLNAVGALFVGLAVSTWDPNVGNDTEIVQQIGLTFSVYTINISAGAIFFQDLRKQTSLLTSAAIVSLLGALVAALGGHLLHLPKGLTLGIFTGSLTAAPALDATTRVTGGPQAAVDYAFDYPIGVIVGILIVTMTVTRKRVGMKDTPLLAGKNLETLTVQVTETVSTRHVRTWRKQRVYTSYLHCGDITRVVIPGKGLKEGDFILPIGDPENIKETASQIGVAVDHHPGDDRLDVAFERIVISNLDVVGRSISALSVSTRFGAVITCVHRGDLDLLARDNPDLQSGGHVAVIVPIEELENIQSQLGDSEKRVSEVDAMAFGIGMALGMLFGALPFPIPEGATLELGSTAGPLIVGTLLDALRRTGLLVRSLPTSANLTVRQTGPPLSLAGLGSGTGLQLSVLLTNSGGPKAALLALFLVLLCCAAQALAGRFAGLSVARSVGGVAGFLGQPAVLQVAGARTIDERTEATYATFFAFTIIVKIPLMPLIWSI